MIDHEAILRKAAEKIRAANINGWGNACEGGADRIAALEARCRELEDVLRRIAASHGASDHACFRRDLADQALTPPETSPEPNYLFQEPSNLPSQSMTIGAHPGGGPCIHVWALNNRDAVENGRCGICGQSVANRGVKP